MMADVADPLALLEILFRNAPVGFALVDRQFRFIRVNDALAASHGIGPEAHVGKTVSDVVPQLWPKVSAFYARAIRGEIILNEYVCGTSNTGKQRDWHVSYYPLVVSGETVGVGLIVNDVTATRVAEEALRRRSNLYAMLAETNRAVGRCRAFGELFREVCAIAVETGRFRFAWVGAKRGEGFHVVASAGDDAGYLNDLVISLKQGDKEAEGPIGRSLNLGTPVIVNDFMASPMTAPWHEAGRRASVAASAGFPLTEQGRVSYVLNLYAGERNFFTDELIDTLSEVARSVSFALDAFAGERTHTDDEAALLIRERAIQAVSQGIVITDPNQADNPITYVSPGFERITGYTAAEVLGKNGRFLCGPGTDPAMSARIGAAVREGRSESVELLNYRKDGSSFWNLLMISPVHGSAGEITHFVGVQSDVTDRRQLETQLRQAQKMEAVGRLAAGIAHDFNNLLCVITGYSSLALSEMKSGTPLRDGIAEIARAADRAADLTRQLLAFSRQQALHRRVTDLNHVISGMEKMLRRLLSEEIELSIRLGPAVGHIYVDPGQLEQVILNLAVNARDAMPSGGTVILETADATLPEAYAAVHEGVVAGDYAMISFSDNGSGMDAATRDHAFEPFFTTKDVGRGTGLGLSVVFGIVQQSGGHISVESEVGRGTTFRIYLPRTDADYSPPGEVLTAPATLRGGETVLLVEDSTQVRAMMRTVLTRYGYNVLEAENAGEAFLVCEQNDPVHLLLTDIVMPRMSGQALATRLRAMRPGMKVLYMSGYADTKGDDAALSPPPVPFIQKPTTAEALLASVRRVLDGTFTS